MQMLVKEETPAATCGKDVAGKTQHPAPLAYIQSPIPSNLHQPFLRLPLRVALDRKLTRADLAVLGVLILHSGYTDSTTWVSLRKVATVARLSARQVRRSVKRLIHMGYVQKIPHDGHFLYVVPTERPYIKLPPSILWDKRVPRAALAVYCVLVAYARNNGFCWPTVHQLARRTGQNPRVVRRELRRLEGLGYLHTEASNPGWGRGHRTLYWLQTIKEIHDTCELAKVSSKSPSEPAGRRDKRRTNLSPWPLQGSPGKDLHEGSSADGFATNVKFAPWPVQSAQTSKCCPDADKAIAKRRTGLSFPQSERDSERDPEAQAFEKGAQKEDIPVRERRTFLSTPTVETNADLNSAEVQFLGAERNIIERDINNLLDAPPSSDESGARPEGLAPRDCTQAALVEKKGRLGDEMRCYIAREFQLAEDAHTTEVVIDPVLRFAAKNRPFTWQVIAKQAGGYERLRREYQEVSVARA